MNALWAGTTDVSSKLEEGASEEERQNRSLALEKTYVHDVYQEIACHFTDTRYRAWPRVKQFLLDLEPGSIVCDVGCGNGKHMGINQHLFKLGVDRSSNLATATRDKSYEVLTADNLTLPFRDDCVDAVLSVAVVHHFATAGRRVEALKELARVLRIGGKILVTVWAMEQRHRKFESQDVLVPWNRPLLSSCDDKTSSIERDLNSTTTTSDDDATHYHAYTQTSDSDSFPSLRDLKKRVRLRHRGQSIDPACSSQSSSDLSSPNESCYTFVRRAIQKLARTKRNRVGRAPWFLQGLGLGEQDELIEPLASMDEDAGEDIKEGPNDPGSSNFSELFRFGESSSMARRSLIFSNLLSTRRRRTLETTRELQHPKDQILAQHKSKSLSDLLGMIPIGLFRSTWNRSPDTQTERKQVSRLSSNSDKVATHDSSFLKLDFDLSQEDVEFPECVAHKSVQTEGFESLSFASGSLESRTSSLAGHYKGPSSDSPDIQGTASKSVSTRPILVKQKHSVSSPLESFDLGFELGANKGGPSEFPEVSWGDIKTSVKNLPEFKPVLPTQVHPQKSSLRVTHPGPSVWKQSSLNEDLIFSERLREKETLKQHITKQCSLNEEFLSKKHEHENTRWDQMKEAFLNNSNVKCIQQLKNGLSNRFRGYETTAEPNSFTPLKLSPDPKATPPIQATNSIRSGLVRILQNWKQGESEDSGVVKSPSSVFMGSRSSGQAPRKSIFPPFFMRRNSSGSLNVAKKDLGETSPLKLLSPPPYLGRKPSENDLIHESGRLGTPVGNKLVPGVRHVRKLSREDGGSDSSKDSSFQSDTSVDSEDSFASVIFIPKGAENGRNDFFGSETRANSTDSDRSSKSPALRLSPPNNSSTPKSPSPLATEIGAGRRRSPEISPTRNPFLPNIMERGNKFNFDDNATKFMLSSTSSSTLTCGVSPSGVSPSGARALEAGPSDPIPEIVLAPPPILAQEKVDNDPDGKIPFVPAAIQQADVTQVSPKSKRIEKIDVLRKPGNLPKNKAEITRKLVRRSLPKALAVELYNPETDDADTSDSSSSSPNSVSSVVSVVTEDSTVVAQRREAEERILETKSSEKESLVQETIGGPYELSRPGSVKSKSSASRDSSLETGPGSFESSDSLGSHSSTQSKRKLTLVRLGNTTDWLSTLPSAPCDVSVSGPYQAVVTKRPSLERRHPGEKILLGEVKKLQSKGPDAKWPSCFIDVSPSMNIPSPQVKVGSDEREPQIQCVSPSAEATEKLLVELEEQDSLFDSIENLTGNRQEPSRNPSFDSSLRMSSTCSCSIRGGDSFESYCSSAKSSMTNSSHRNSGSFMAPPCGAGRSSRASPTERRRRRQDLSKSSSVTHEEGEEPDPGKSYHRYYHVFREGELDKLIEKYVQNLHIISSYYDHANWCIIAEKVQVWTI